MSESQFNLISWAVLIIAVALPILAITLSKRGRRTTWMTIVSFTCLIIYMLLGYYRIIDLADNNNLTMLIQNIAFRTRLSIIFGIAIIILNFVPVLTYRTREDYEKQKAADKVRKEYERQQQAAKMAEEEQLQEAGKAASDTQQQDQKQQ